MKKSIIIVTIKNRLNHFLKTFPFMVSQYGTPYDLVLVDFYSNDRFRSHLLKEIDFRKEMFSPFLDKIKCIKLLKDLKFNPRKARNLGASYYKNKDVVFAFSDADVFLGMTYLNFWIDKVEENKSFVAMRIQDTKSSLPSRINPEINYGNFLVHSHDFFAINGFDENVGHYGGDDDDVYHRLKLLKLREINPHGCCEARQYSIIHDDSLRLSQMEVTHRVDQAKAFEKVYKNTEYFVKNSIFLNSKHTKNISQEEVLYEK